MSNITSTYTFVSWLRRGMAGQIKKVDPLQTESSTEDRQSVQLNVNIRSDNQTRGQIGRSVTLYDPGDIIGIDQKAIVKTEPRQGILNFEANYFPYIEFYDEDFPWRYTPAAANGKRLRPWMTLIVLEEQEFEFRGISNSTLPSIFIKNGSMAGPFPPPDQIWAWAHAHVNTHLSSDNSAVADVDLKNLLDQTPNIGSSRIICPRKLKNKTSYHAFLIPTFERGRLAGLGAEDSMIKQASNLQSSWGQFHQAMPDQWPFYFEWQFSTGAEGDFESLVRKIQPHKDLDERIGKEPMDIQNPGFSLHYGEGEESLQGTIMLEGALRQHGEFSPPMSNWDGDGAKAFVKDLRDLLNLDADLKERNVQSKFALNPFFDTDDTSDSASIYDDPIVTPPFYGKFHAQQKRVSIDDKWYNQLNLDPKFRTAAGFGTQVIQKNQDHFMDRAWQQFGDILEANQKIRQEQLSLKLNEALQAKHITSPKINASQLTAITASIHQKVKVGAETVSNKIDQNQLVSNAFVHPGYYRITRPRGPLMRRIQSQNKTQVFNQTKSETDWRMSGAAAYQTQFLRLGMPNISMIFTNLNQAAPVFQAHFSQGKLTADFEDVPTTGLNLLSLKSNILIKINPKKRAAKRVQSTMGGFVGESQEVSPIMAAPSFLDPMYKGITALSSDYLMPNLDLIPDNSYASFETNNTFIEAYMVGLNHEMARELLWREYPTDQRGTYFNQFWDIGDNLVNPQADIKAIHQWSASTPLGDISHSPGQNEANLVFSIRGELLRKYPNTIVYMQRAKWTSDEYIKRELDESANSVAYPLFQANVDPDIYFFGFNRTAKEARGDDPNDPNSPNKPDPGWFFVLKERSGEVRFGLDIDPDPNQTTWANLSWADLPEVDHHIDLDRDKPGGNIKREGLEWGKGEAGVPDQAASGNGSAADMASILYQKPFMVAVHALKVIPL